MELIKEKTKIKISNESCQHPQYKVRKDGRNVDMYCHGGFWIADKNYILYDNVLYPITIHKDTTLTIG